MQFETQEPVCLADTQLQSQNGLLEATTTDNDEQRHFDSLKRMRHILAEYIDLIVQTESLLGVVDACDDEEARRSRVQDFRDYMKVHSRLRSQLEDYGDRIWVSIWLDEEGRLTVADLIPRNTTASQLLSWLPAAIRNTISEGHVSLVVLNGYPQASSLHPLSESSATSVDEIMQQAAFCSCELHLGLEVDGRRFYLSDALPSRKKLSAAVQVSPARRTTATSPPPQAAPSAAHGREDRRPSPMLFASPAQDTRRSGAATTPARPSGESRLHAQAGSPSQRAPSGSRNRIAHGANAERQAAEGRSPPKCAGSSARAQEKSPGRVYATNLFAGTLGLEFWNLSQSNPEIAVMEKQLQRSSPDQNRVHGSPTAAVARVGTEAQAPASPRLRPAVPHMQEQDVPDPPEADEPTFPSRWHGDAANGSGLGNKRRRVEGHEPPAMRQADAHGHAQPDGHREGARKVPPTLLQLPNATPRRFEWKVPDVTLLLEGIEEFGPAWSMIQAKHFPNYRGSAFQSKMKDKWRVLCQGVKRKSTTRTHLPEHLWAKVEHLAKLYGMS